MTTTCDAAGRPSRSEKGVKVTRSRSEVTSCVGRRRTRQKCESTKSMCASVHENWEGACTAGLTGNAKSSLSIATFRYVDTLPIVFAQKHDENVIIKTGTRDVDLKIA